MIRFLRILFCRHDYEGRAWSGDKLLASRCVKCGRIKWEKKS